MVSKIKACMGLNEEWMAEEHFITSYTSNQEMHAHWPVVNLDKNISFAKDRYIARANTKHSFYWGWLKGRANIWVNSIVVKQKQRILYCPTVQNSTYFQLKYEHANAHFLTLGFKVKYNGLWDFRGGWWSLGFDALLW